MVVYLVKKFTSQYFRNYEIAADRVVFYQTFAWSFDVIRLIVSKATTFIEKANSLIRTSILLKKLIMQYYQITVVSKNEKSLKDYLTFFYENIKFYKLTSKMLNKKTKKNFVTILKSPHVNKKAQEQFGYNIFSKQLLVFSANNYQLMLFLKKIEKNLFSDIIIKIRLQLNKNLPEKLKKKIFNPDNFKICFLNKNIFFANRIKKIKLLKNDLSFFNKTKQFFNIFDIYGEINQKTSNV
jgi:ribosomal protein S10